MSWQGEPERRANKIEMENIIEVENITYTYAGGTKALDGVSYQIKKGEKVAFLGSNGSGKSTMFLCLNGILKPQSGCIKINKKPIVYNKKGLFELRKKIGIVFQEPDDQLFSSSVEQEISFGLFNMGLEQTEVRNRVDKVIDTLEMASFKDRPTHFLSGGQKKRVSIADIIVMEPEVIIFDEPVSSLDPKHTEVVYDIIDDLQRQGITVIISTHDVNHAYRWADKIVVFHEGKILSVASPIDTFNNDTLLETANLKKPFVMELYERFIKAGWKSRKEDSPKTLDELEQYIRNHQEKENE